MRHHRYTFAIVFMLSLVTCGLFPRRVTADPIPVSGSLTGAARFALVDQELRLAFPDFAILIDPQTQLTPRFPQSAADGSTISLTRTLASFSGHSLALPGNGIIDADVSGTLSFVGPSGILDVPDDIRFGSVSGPVHSITVMYIMWRSPTSFIAADASSSVQGSHGSGIPNIQGSPCGAPSSRAADAEAATSAVLRIASDGVVRLLTIRRVWDHAA